MDNQMTNLINRLNTKFQTSIFFSSKSSELNCKFKVPIQLDSNLNYEIGLIYFSTYNSIFNILEPENIIFIKTGAESTSEELKLLEGSYEIDDISKNIDLYLLRIKNIKLPENETSLVKIIPNPSSINCILKITSGLKIEIKFSNNISKMSGFEDKYYSEGIHFSKHVNISDINSILIECNIADGTYISKSDEGFSLAESTNIIYDFPSNSVKRGRRIIEQPNFPIYFPVINKYISEIRIRILDDKMRLINFNGEEICLRLHLQQI